VIGGHCVGGHCMGDWEVRRSFFCCRRAERRTGVKLASELKEERREEARLPAGVGLMLSSVGISDRGMRGGLRLGCGSCGSSIRSELLDFSEIESRSHCGMAAASHLEDGTGLVARRLAERGGVRRLGGEREERARARMRAELVA